MEYVITSGRIAAYAAALRQAGRTDGTIAQYRRSVAALARWLDGAPVTEASLTAWREHLREANQPATVNAMLAAANGFFKFAGWPMRVKFLKIQRRLFREPGRELTRAEYDRLLRAAQAQGRERLALLMETICATGDSRFRGAVYHRRSRPSGAGGNRPQGKNSHDFTAK